MGNSNSQTNEEKLVEERATKETYIECPVLVDFEHGTIRHRHQEGRENIENDKLKIGYFYHPRLKDFSEEANDVMEDSNRLKYVFKGPLKDVGKKIYYIYGTKTSDKDSGLHSKNYKPKGKGFNWPRSYRNPDHSYYEVSLIGETSSNVGEIEFYKDIVRMYGFSCDETVKTTIERISLELLVPAANIHLLIEDQELLLNDQLRDIFNVATEPYVNISFQMI